MSSTMFATQTHVLPCQHIREYPGATLNEQEDVLHLELKQYTPLDNPNPKPGDVTIIGAHACGFPKEIYEPLWDEILHRSKQNGFAIRSIWVADVSHQGASGVLNEYIQGNDPSWFDHSRDLLHAINHFRTSMPRPLIGIGHSMGACQLAHLSLLHPRLLHSLILLDPVIARFGTLTPTSDPGRASTFRCDLWPSLPAATAAFTTSKFYSRWDPRVLALFLAHGLRPLPTALYPLPAAYPPASVTLTTSKHQEVFTFSRPNFSPSPRPPRTTHPDLDPSDPNTPFYRPEPVMTFDRLPEVRPSVLYVFGEDSPLSTAEMQEAKVARTGTGVGGSGGRAEARVAKVVLRGTGHLVAMEEVTGCGEASAQWMGHELRRWREEEKVWREGWDAMDVGEKTTMGEKWYEANGGGKDRGSKL